MKAFSFEVRRVNLVKLLLGVSGVLYVVRMIMGAGDYYVIAGVSVGGIKELFVMSLAVSAVFLLWNIRDTVVRD